MSSYGLETNEKIQSQQRNKEESIKILELNNTIPKIKKKEALKSAI